MMERLSLSGLAASPGIAVGRAAVAPSLHRDVARDLDMRRTGLEPLRAAIDAAVSALQKLSTNSPLDSAAILDFQIEMLLDPTIVDMAGERVENGESAIFAWIAAMNDYIVGFEQSDDELTRARAVDVIDMRNRVLDIMMGKPEISFPDGAIYVGGDIEPSLFLAHDWSGGGGIVLFKGSTVSHVATLARSRAVPMVIGTGKIELPSDRTLLVDGDCGRVIVNPQATDMAMLTPRTANPNAFLQTVHRPDRGMVRTADGVPIQISINVNNPAELDRIDPLSTAGIGLLRTEFLLPSPAGIFNEDEQFATYRRILQWAGEQPVTIRLFDLGGDKALPSIIGEHGSFMGLRGVRLLLAKPEILRIQARALLRAASFGTLRLMLPMVTIPREFETAARIIHEEAESLSTSGKPHLLPQLGMMVETPAAALMLDAFSQADFFSFGTNDLGQYVAAAARDDPAVAALHAEAAPAIYRLIAASMKNIAVMNKPTSICGDMAGHAECLPDLLQSGLRHFSVAPARLAAIKSALASLNADAKQVVPD
jgi:phosphotransferase system enzyme I (PtsI)